MAIQKLTLSDEKLIESALDGDKKSLESLIKRYQDFVYNISLKMFLDLDDALDATQEVLIKVVTHLKSFQMKSKFSTWLYRITVNHFINSPARKMESLYDRQIDITSVTHQTIIPDNTISEEEIEEVRILCSTAMLMCLSREQRLIYIIGEIFGVGHQLGAELFEITPSNFRVKLHRAKSDLLQFVSGKCGLINPNNPCRCHKKANIMVNEGIVNKEKMRFNVDYQQKINQIVLDKRNKVSDEIKFNLQTLFRDSPFQIKQELDKLLSEIVK